MTTTSLKGMYSVEVEFNGEWITLFQFAKQAYCKGYLAASRDVSPRPALRIIRQLDGKVMDEISAHDELPLGQTAGLISAEQLELAAQKALERAAAIRRMGTRSKGSAT